MLVELFIALAGIAVSKAITGADSPPRDDEPYESGPDVVNDAFNGFPPSEDGDRQTTRSEFM